MIVAVISWEQSWHVLTILMFNFNVFQLRWTSEISRSCIWFTWRLGCQRNTGGEFLTRGWLGGFAIYWVDVRCDYFGTSQESPCKWSRFDILQWFMWEISCMYVIMHLLYMSTSTFGVLPAALRRIRVQSSYGCEGCHRQKNVLRPVKM